MRFYLPLYVHLGFKLLSFRESEEIWDLRENELKSLFEEKVCQLVSDRLHADSKAVAFYFECEALQHRLGR